MVLLHTREKGVCGRSGAKVLVQTLLKNIESYAGDDVVDAIRLLHVSWNCPENAGNQISKEYVTFIGNLCILSESCHLRFHQSTRMPAVS